MTYLLRDAVRKRAYVCIIHYSEQVIQIYLTFNILLFYKYLSHIYIYICLNVFGFMFTVTFSRSNISIKQQFLTDWT